MTRMPIVLTLFSCLACTPTPTPPDAMADIATPVRPDLGPCRVPSTTLPGDTNIHIAGGQIRRIYLDFPYDMTTLYGEGGLCDGGSPSPWVEVDVQLARPPVLAYFDVSVGHRKDSMVCGNVLLMGKGWNKSVPTNLTIDADEPCVGSPVP